MAITSSQTRSNNRLDSKKTTGAVNHCIGGSERDALLDALTSGLPESYGVALGVDRLLQVMTQSKTLSECMTFTGHL